MISSTESGLRLGILIAVLVHLGISLWHGAAHNHVPVPLTTLQTIFVGLVVVLLPLVGTGMLWTSKYTAGAWLVALCMFGSFIFGVLNHFVLQSPDYVLEVPEHPWQHAFVFSAALLAASEAIGTLLAALAIRK